MSKFSDLSAKIVFRVEIKNLILDYCKGRYHHKKTIISKNGIVSINPK